MFSIVRRHTLIAFTLLALLSQVLLSNGSWMVPHAMANDAPVMKMQGQAECQPAQMNQMDSDSPCCDSAEHTQMLPGSSSHCSEGKGSCPGDCNHCLVISVTGTLFNIKSWSGFNAPELAMATPMPYFHSISLPQDLRPPIA